MKYLEGYMERHTEGEEKDLHFLMIVLFLTILNRLMIHMVMLKETGH